MYDPKWLRDHSEELDRALARRGLPGEAQQLISIDERRRAIIRVLERWRERRNAASKDIGQAKVKKDEATVQKLMAEVAECKTSISTLEGEQRAVDEELHKALELIPNVPAADVPDGPDASANKERHRFGETPKFTFQPKQHFELGEALGLMDFETAAKLSGARFVVLKGALARLERAISQFFLDVHTTEFGYTEVAPPLLVRDDVMFGTAQLPKFRADQFKVNNHDHYPVFLNVAGQFPYHSSDIKLAGQLAYNDEDELRNIMHRLASVLPTESITQLESSLE